MYASERGSTGASSMRVFHQLSGGKMPTGLDSAEEVPPDPASGAGVPESAPGAGEGPPPPVIGPGPFPGLVKFVKSGPALQAVKRRMSSAAVTRTWRRIEPSPHSRDDVVRWCRYRQRH